MKVGDKIRDLRMLKKLSQENMAEMLNMSLGAYGDIERNKKDMTLSRLEKIAETLGVSVSDILNFDDKVSNFFDQCNNPQVNSGAKHNTFNNNFDNKEVQHQLELSLLENQKLQLRAEKAEIETKYWKEKFEAISTK
ncbi:MAG: helix-turn-helix domain-containing protein [Spirosomataceae bacterium]